MVAVKDNEKTKLEIADLTDEIAMFNQMIFNNTTKIRKLKEVMRVRLGQGGKHTETRAVFSKACPDEDCKGFLSSRWKCGLCEVTYCKDCQEPLEKDHECDEGLVATYKLMKEDTKCCPKVGCGTLISKISGCDQMWCPTCKTAFSWNTGKIVVGGTIHNPHYYEWQRQQNKDNNIPRVRGDIPCGGLADYMTIYYYLLSVKFDDAVIHDIRIDNIHRSVTHIQEVEVPRVAARDIDNKDLRVKYLLGDIKEKELKSTIKQRYKKREKDTAVRQILDMYVATMTALFDNILRKKTKSAITNSLSEFETIRKYVNAELKKVGERYCNVVPIITDEWNVFRNSKKPYFAAPTPIHV
jgi:hypothetical protein